MDLKVLKAEDLSPEAQKLVELCGVGRFIWSTEQGRDKISVSQAIKEHPELLSALDEYIKYREKNSAELERQTTSPRVQHSLAKRAKKKPKK